MEFLKNALNYLQGSSEIAMLVRLLLATLAGAIIGAERGRHGRAAGLRTHALVCLGAALAAELGLFAQSIQPNTDPLRVAAQVISGIGFLGVGTILVKGRFQITGLTTAAGLWATAAIGLAFGIGFLSGALIGTVFTMLTIICLSYLEFRLNRRHRRFGIYVELTSVTFVQEMTAHLKECYLTNDVQITPPRSALVAHVGVEASIHTKDTGPSVTDVIDELNAREGVAFSLESI
ncbi:MAG: MgtC/SapB family protein [Clostridia bacterium]|nr:MgtC/SapB family protein [Clostridia bacterium]